MTTSTEKAVSLSVEKLFYGSARYVIPLYQRNYTWGEEQILQLIADIRTAHRKGSDSTYHLGNLVVSPRSSDRFEVIDGQQRLTTLFMLLAHLDGAAGGSVKATPPGYEARPKATAALQLLPKSAEDITEADDVDPMIAAASVLIYEQIAGQVDPADAPLEKLAGYLKESVKLIRMEIPQSTDLNRYFEVMNTRGVQLRPVDIVKARLMKLLEDKEDRRVFDIVWRGCSDMSRYVQMTVTPGSTSLRGTVFGADWTELPDDYDDLKSSLAADTDDAGEPTAGSEPMGLGEAVDLYMTDGRGLKAPEDDDEADRFSSQVTFEVFLLHLLAVMGLGDEEESQLDDKKLIAKFTAVTDRIEAEQSSSSAQSSSPAQWVRHFTVSLLRYRMLFDRYVIKRDNTLHPGSESLSDDVVGDWSLDALESERSRGKTQPRYRRTFPDRDVQKQIVLLQSALRITYTSPRGMHWITEVLRYVGSNPTVSGGDLLVFLQEWTRGKVKAAMAAGPDEGFPVGFSTPRILFSYLDYLLVKDSPDDYRDYRFGYRNSIEHFVPQNWDREKNADKFELTDTSLLDDFGNLALVSVSANSKFSNNTPTEKAGFDAARAQSPKLDLMCKRLEEDGGQWKDSQVESHRNEMLRLLRADLAGTDVGPVMHADPETVGVSPDGRSGHGL